MDDCLRLRPHKASPGPVPGAGAGCSEVQGTGGVAGVETVRDFLALHFAKVGHMVDMLVFSSKKLQASGGDFLPRQRLVTGLLHTIDPVSGLVYVVSVASAANSAASAASAGEGESDAASTCDVPGRLKTAAASEKGESTELCSAGGEAAATVDAKVSIFNFRFVSSVEARPDLRGFEVVTGRHAAAAAAATGRSTGASASSHRAAALGGSDDRDSRVMMMAHGEEGGSARSTSGAAGLDPAAAGTRARKDRLMKQLCALRVAFEEEEDDGTLRILHGALRIHPPYTLADCVSKNETVLQRVAGMLEF